ncbi:MAG: hypothetical protein DSM106950_34235 [Stigonema ocellatum SAG 48.90 = DSM 106950]|nr:hypothetical protein [Stigonema ocellatum SAG 48.90 = DSM 106950]
MLSPWLIEPFIEHDELDFLFPEITRIHNHDLVLLNSWHNHMSWIQSLPLSDLKLLSCSDFKNSEITVSSELNQTTPAFPVPSEQLIYEELAEKSHFYSLRDQLLFMFEPKLRREYEFYISQQAKIYGYRTLVTSNLQQASDLTVANLYSYFNIRNKSEDVAEEVTFN